MKRLKDGTFQFSPSDLTTFLESLFSAWMNRYDLEFPGKIKRDADDEAEELLQDKGMKHEKKVFEEFTSLKGNVVTIASTGDFTSRHLATLAAMQSGADVIYQAALTKPPFMGYADFLVKVPGKSKLGDFHYEAWDSKLARSTKPYFIIQLLAYSEMLEEAQGVFPQAITVVLGTGEQKVFKTQEFKNYYSSVKNRFLEFQTSFDVSQKPTPQKSEEIRDWSDHAAELLIAKDDLSQVAGIKSSQMGKLELAGIDTLTGLATTSLVSVPRLDQSTLEKLKRQARLQLASKGQSTPKYEILPHPVGERVGLRALPPPSSGDVYFDMEGYPLFDDGGLEYLFGAVYRDVPNGSSQPSAIKFIDLWAHNHVEEKKAFEAWIDWVYARFKKDPSLHIYHYAAYEVTAMRKLSTKYATKEAQVDDLLRHEVFVDLYKVVKQALAVGEPSYSIKNIEHLYGQKREGEVTNAGASIVQYALYLAEPDGADYHSSKTLKDIRDYNEIDCLSTLNLSDWLRALQTESKLDYFKKENILDAGETPAELATPATLLAQALLLELDGKEALTGDETVQKLLAELLEFHRREAKQYWWKYFDWINSTHEELIDQSECIGHITRTQKTPVPEKQSLIAEYRFNLGQDIKFSPGSQCQVYVNCDQRLNGTIQDIDHENGCLTLKMSNKKLSEVNGFPKTASILPGPPVTTDALKASLLAIVSTFNQTKQRQSLPRAIADLLYRDTPRIEGVKYGDPLIKASDLDPNQVTDLIINLIRRMQETTICIQGPPGAGKTYTGSHVIAALLKDGVRVGVTSNSHKAIENLMTAVLRVAKKEDFKITGYKSGGEPGFLEETGFREFKNKDLAALSHAKNGHILIGGTAWAFSHEEACHGGEPILDYLFVDEAGQVSLANLVAMSRSAKNIVLMGDQCQLEQPIQGSHPGESGESCLNYLMREHATIPPELGVFLGTTFRMRPEVCAFISDHFYESRLASDCSTLENELVLNQSREIIKSLTGILFIPVEHEDCSQSSEAEAKEIKLLIAELLTSEIKNKTGRRAVELKDILVVAPYNLQVDLLKRTLPVGLEIGSVDKFQGREAAVVILSMCSSSLEASPRGVEFLFNPNRLNVALSRAQCLAIVVGNPELAATDGTTIEKMRLVNLFCGIVGAGAMLGDGLSTLQKTESL